MIKTVLATTIIALGMSAGAAFAQERTVPAWGHDFTVNDTTTRDAYVALAPRSPLVTRAIPVDHQAPHRDTFYP